MAENYVLLDSVTVNTNTASVIFDNLPTSGYSDLKITMSARQSGATGGTATYQDRQNIYFNGSTSGYSEIWIQGEGVNSISSGTAYFGSSGNKGLSGTVPPSDFTSQTGQNAFMFNNVEIYIPNYRSSTTNKIWSVDCVTPNISTTRGSILNAYCVWASTAAITSITLSPNTNSWLVGSTFALYGLASSTLTPTVGPSASGGNVIGNDGTYWYHAFLSSGDFIPAKDLTANILVVAGGGSGASGGNSGGAGGGGAGGLLEFASQSLTAGTQYNCLVGAGAASISRTGGVAAKNGLTGSDSQFASLTLVKGGGFGGGGLLDGVGGNGGTGGSGGGAGRWSNSTSQFGGSPTTGQGFKGGDALSSGAGGRNGVGGGGAGGAGVNRTNVGDGDGGIGSSAYSSWGLATTTGQNSSGTVYYAGGGGGSGVSNLGAGGLGGGGAGPTPTSGAQTATSGTPNTGGGGGGIGGADEASRKTSGSGGSGIVIVRYPMV
jgi:hypothetical protein